MRPSLALHVIKKPRRATLPSLPASLYTSALKHAGPIPALSDKYARDAYARNGSKKSRRSPTTDALEFFGDGFVHWQATLLCMSTYIREPSSVKTNLRNILIENTTLAGLADAAELSGKISPPVGAPPRLEKARANSFECHLGGLLLDGRREEAANWVEDVFRVLAKHVVGGPLERVNHDDAIEQVVYEKTIRERPVLLRPTHRDQVEGRRFNDPLSLEGKGYPHDMAR